MAVPAAKTEALRERYDGAGYLGLLTLLLQTLSRRRVIAVARYREYVADDGAVAITGEPAARNASPTKKRIERLRFETTDSAATGDQ